MAISRLFEPSVAYAVGGGDVCERRLRREKRAKRSGRIKAIGKRALPAQTEPLIQQNMSPPYRRLKVNERRGEHFMKKRLTNDG